MAAHRAARPIGRVQAYLLRRKLNGELDRLVAQALSGTSLRPGSPQLNRHVQQPRLLAGLTGRLLGQDLISKFFQQKELETLLVRSREHSDWVAASVGRVHRCQLGVQADELNPALRIRT